MVKDIQDGVVVFKRVAPPKSGNSPTLVNMRTLTPMSITSETSDDDLNGSAENSGKRIHERIMRKKYDAFTRKLRKAELK